MRFVFDKKFKFNLFSKIMECHKQYNKLVEFAYEKEENYNSGKCTKDDWIQALNKCEEYYLNTYANCVYNEFNGKNLIICDWKTKQKVKFDEKFIGEFTNLTNSDRGNIVSIVEIKYGWKLPKEYYE